MASPDPGRSGGTIGESIGSVDLGELGGSDVAVSPPVVVSDPEDHSLPLPSVRHRHPLFVRNAVKLIPEPIKSSLKPPKTKHEWLDFLLMKIPIIGWVWGYKVNYFIGDIISGITVAIMHIPQGLAYALLANVQPIFGLYASFVPVLVYSIMGTSRHISVGTFAVVELMIGNSVDKIISGDDTLSMFCQDGDTNDSTSGGCYMYVPPNLTDMTSAVSFQFYGNTTTNCIDVKLDIVVTLAFLSGLFMFFMGVFQLGFITIFLSEPLISGYTTGAAMHVFTSQLQHITGLADSIKVPNGPLKVPRTWIAMFENFTCIKPATIIISVIAIIFLIIFKILNKLLKSPKVKIPVKIYRRSQKKWVTERFPWPVPIPSQLIVVIVATVIAYVAEFEDRYKVIPVGNIPIGPPGVTVPRQQFILPLIQDAFVIAIVTFSVSVSLAKVFAREFGYSINSNQEFLAYGIMNIIGSFFSSFTAAGSLSRSSIQAVAGGKTQLVGFISSFVILLVLLKLGSLFEPLPRAILASIIWVALYGMFKQFKDVYSYWKLCWWDAAVWMVVFLATTFLGVDLGLGVGVGFSLLVIVLRIILPTSSVLGQAHKAEEVFRNMDNFEEVDTIPGILIFRFQAPICFVNSRVFRLRLEIACGLLNKTALKTNRNTEGCLQTLCYKAGVIHKGSYNITSQEDMVAFNANRETVSLQFSQSNISNVSNINHLPSIEPIHTVVIDCAPIGFMDAVGVKTLQQIVTDFDKLGIQVLFVCMTKENRDIMGRCGFFRKCGKKWLFPSMQDAIRHAQYEPVLHPLPSEPATSPQENGANGIELEAASSSSSMDHVPGEGDGGLESDDRQSMLSPVSVELGNLRSTSSSIEGVAKADHTPKTVSLPNFKSKDM